MPKRMSEKDRVRGTKRVLILIANANKYGQITCQYCNESIVGYPCIDHFVSRATGGDPKAINNLVTACNTCNTKKGKKSVVEVFGQEKHNEIAEYMKVRLFSPNDLAKAREINRMYTKTKDVLQAVTEYSSL